MNLNLFLTLKKFEVVNHLEAEQIFSENLYKIKSKVIVVVAKPWNEISTQEITLLTKILGSIKLTIDAVQILNKQQTSLQELTIYQPSAIILFGVNFTPSIKPYAIETFDGINVIYSESLDSLDDANKKNLWVALKQVFSI